MPLIKHQMMSPAMAPMIAVYKAMTMLFLSSLKNIPQKVLLKRFFSNEVFIIDENVNLPNSKNILQNNHKDYLKGGLSCSSTGISLFV